MQKNNPILINVPHSSTYIPPEELVYFTTSNLQHELDVMTDHYCDDLYENGSSLIRFPVSRLVCDPERFRGDKEEIMATVGMGAVYTACSDGKQLRSITPSHKEEILAKYYDPYHKELEDAVEDKIKTYGKCLIIDGHSFPAVPLPYELDQDVNRPDICIGTDEIHTPRDIEELLCGCFADRGYSVEINRPFAGCIVPMKYYRRDMRVMSVMIELNRHLYMDHMLNKTDGYGRIKADIVEAIESLRNYME